MGEMQPVAIPGGLIRHLAAQLPQPHLGYRLRELVIFEHARHVEIF